MARELNQVFLIGALTARPVRRRAGAGTPVLEATLAGRAWDFPEPIKKRPVRGAPFF